MKNEIVTSSTTFSALQIANYLVTTYSVRGLRLFSPIAVASSTKRARPKSVIRSLQSFDTRMLPGFKSRSESQNRGRRNESDLCYDIVRK
jgi:hypothetical protein